MPGIKPKLNKRLPHDWMNYFDLNSDKKFKKEHPILYPFLVVLGTTALLAPMIPWVFIMSAVGIELDSIITHEVVLGSVGLIGCFAIGTGLFNIVAAFLNQYLGHKVTLVSIGAGLCIWALVIIILLLI